MVIDSLIAGLPDFLAQSATCFAVLIFGLVIYMWMTPHKEMALIRDGNSAASLSLAAQFLVFPCLWPLRLPGRSVFLIWRFGAW